MMLDCRLQIEDCGLQIENCISNSHGLVRSLICHPELVSGSYNYLILLDAELSLP